MSQVTKDKSVRAQMPVVEHHAVPSFGERLLESLRPHLNLILLSVAALVLLFVALAWMMQTRQRAAEGEWMTFNQQLSLMNLTGNTSGIKEIAEEFPDGKAGLWGLMVAGHVELDQGLRTLGRDRIEGLRAIEKAKTTLKKVVDAPASQKSTLLQVRSTYSLAYAHESLGEFESAKVLYQQLVDQAPDSAFANAAQRGIKRCTDPSFAKVYEKFKGWEDPFAVAPGAPTTQKQDISFPELPESAEGENAPPEKSNAGESGELGSSAAESNAPENAQPVKSGETTSPDSDEKKAEEPVAEPSTDNQDVEQSDGEKDKD